MNRALPLLVLAACSSPAPKSSSTPIVPPVPPPPHVATPTPPAPSPDAQLAAYADRFLADYLARSPVEATQAGEHRFDGAWPDLSPAGEQQLHAFLEHARADLPKGPFDAQHQIDATLLADQASFGLFVLDELKPYDRDPVAYTDLIGQGFDPLVNRTFGTPASRLASLVQRLDGVPALVAIARQRLGAQHPAKVNTETAIKQCAGLVDLVETELGQRFPGADAKVALAAPSKRAAGALRELADFLAKDLLPRSDGSFRLGRALFERKLGFVLEDKVDIDQLAATARAWLGETQEAMVETAKQIWTEDKLGKLPALATPAQRKAFVKQVLDHVAKDHPSNKTIVADAKTWLAKATAFVRANDLVSVPDEPVNVVEMPEYRRGVAVAYCDSSGPLEQTPETVFAISPTPADWNAKRVDSFYREYNQSMLADLSIHEAMPGHYLQLMHNNKSASKLRAVFSSGPFVEGWAVYGEWLMAEHGFGGARVKLQRQKMALRLAANAILDHDIHAGTMDEKAARALMMDEAFQEDGEAAGKWRRAELTSAQLTTYFYGFTQLLALREVNAAKPGFTERAYHDRLLSFGSPAIKFIRELMH